MTVDRDNEHLDQSAADGRFYSDEEAKEIAKAAVLTFEYYGGRKLTFEQARAHARDFERWRVPHGVVIKAYGQWRDDTRNAYAPLPAQIRERIRPTLDADSAAKELAARIIAAIKRYGYTYEAAAQAWLGEDAWMIVRQHGGWMALCADMGVNLDPQTFTAQSRDLLRARFAAAPQLLDRVRGHIATNSIRMLAIPRGADSTAALIGQSASRLELEAPAEPEAPTDPEELKRQKAKFESLAIKLGIGADTLAQISGPKPEPQLTDGDAT